jgi:tripartite ATP-independent transporter DctM subunit
MSATEISDSPLAGVGHPSGERRGRFPEWVEHIFDGTLAFILFFELFVLFGNVAVRAVTGQAFIWADEVATISLAAIAFIGGSIAYYEGAHLSVRVVIDRLPPHARQFIEAFGEWATMALAIMSLTLIAPTMLHNLDVLTPALGISKSWVYLPFLIGMVLLVVFCAKRLTAYSARQCWSACASVVGLLLLWYLVQRYSGPWDETGGFIFGGVAIVLAIGIGLPIGFALPIVAALYVVSSKVAGLEAIPMSMSNGISGFIFLAIPFFVLAGDIMTEGGLTQPLADFVCAIVGRMHGGLMQVLVGSMFIFSGISGSKVADVAAVGTTLRNTLREQGYAPEESAAVLAASAIMGETIPPSLPLLVIGSITTVSVGTLFVAGMLPAIFMAACLMVFIWFKARAGKWPRGERTSWRERVQITIRALPVLFVPVMLVVGIVGGIATPTEVSSFAVIYAVLIALLFYRSVDLHGLVKIFSRAAVVAGMILFTISAGAAFSWTMTVAGLPNMIVEFLDYLGGSVTVFLLVSLVALTILGGVLEGLPALLVTVPLLMPIAIQYGLQPVHYAIVLIFAMGMGCFMPPFGIGFYVSCSIGDSSPEKVTPRLLPYLLVLSVGLLLVTFVPWLTLVFPRLLHLVQ